jgi:uncharacterized protein YjiS (DUF1127 family)
MVIGQIWLNANPGLRDHLRKVNEERSSAFYATWRAVTTRVGGLIEAVRRARRASETYGSLSRLNDRQLQDIGISRSEIGSIAQAVAEAPPGGGLTIAELQRSRQTAPAGPDARVVPLARADQRRGSRAAAQPASAVPAEPGRVAA